MELQDVKDAIKGADPDQKRKAYKEADITDPEIKFFICSHLPKEEDYKSIKALLFRDHQFARYLNPVQVEFLAYDDSCKRAIFSHANVDNAKNLRTLEEWAFDMDIKNKHTIILLLRDKIANTISDENLLKIGRLKSLDTDFIETIIKNKTNSEIKKETERGI